MPRLRIPAGRVFVEIASSRGLSRALGLVVVFALTSIAVPIALPVAAQEVTGAIGGTVTDPNGAVIPGAKVELVTEQKIFTALTDGEGGYQFHNVLPGTHALRASASSFGTRIAKDILIEVGRTLRANFTLEPGPISEQVTITTSDEPFADVTSTQVATNITREEFQHIPKTLNFTSVLELASGVRQESKAVGFSVDGASGVENIFLLDGVEAHNVWNGVLSPAKNVPFDFVREVQVKTAGYEAEFGGATGGVINVVTRSGRNDLHGEVRFELELDELRARPNPVLRLNPVHRDRAEYYLTDNMKNDDRLFAPVFNLGGPIMRDKLWFYASYAPQFERVEQNLNLVEHDEGGTVVLDTRPNERETTFTYYLARVDYSPVDKLQTYASFIGSPVYVEGQLVGTNNETISQVTFDDQRHRFKGGYIQSWNLAAASTYTPTDSVVVSVRGGRSYLNDKGTSYDIPVGTPRYDVFVPCVGDEFPCPPGTMQVGSPIIRSNFASRYNITTRTNFDADATYVTRFLGQQHIFKGGYQLTRLSSNIDEGLQGGRVDLYFDRSFGGQRGEYGYWRLSDRGSFGNVESSNRAIFVQDSWTVHPRLILQLGIRFESEYLPSFPINATFHPTIDPERIASAPAKPIEFGWGDKVSPRIGASWDVLGDQRLKIYGSYGRFFDTMKYWLARRAFGGERFLWWRYTLDTLDVFSISLGNRPGTLIAGPLDLSLPASLAPKPGEQPGLDRDLEPTRSHEITAGADYTFAPDWLLGFRFTRKELDRTIEDVGRHDADRNEIYTIGNPGYGVTQDTTFFAPFPAPAAVREYTGYALRLEKRFSSNWYANIAYLYSQLYGNYTGLASADEVDYTTGQGYLSPNVNRYWDFPTMVFDVAGNETLGRLPTDRPHTLKAYASYRLNYWNMSTDVGGTQLAYSGTPVTTRVLMLDAEHIAFGREDLGRTDAFTQTNVLITHRWNITERVAAKFTFNVLNLWDERNELIRHEEITAVGNQLEVDMSDFPTSAYTDYLTLGYDGVRTRLAAQADAPPGPGIDPRYNLPSIFQAPRSARFGFGIEF
jgi:hypothetical protein